MNPTLITYIGFGVAVLIILWAVIELTRRYTRQRNVTIKVRDTWVTVKPTTTHVTGETSVERDDASKEDIIDAELHRRSTQNGHYSPTPKKP